MTNIDDLRDQLERLGRRPVPMPRPEFADDLLRKLQSGEAPDVLPMPTPIGPRERRRTVPARLVAMSSIAAALVLVIGLIGLTSGGSSKQDMSFSFDSIEPTPIGSTTVDDVKLDDSGTILKDVQDGWATATCQKGGQFKISGGGTYTCQAGDTMQVRVENNRIVEVRPAPQVSTVEEVAAEAPESPTTTVAPQSTSASTTSTTRPTTSTTSSVATNVSEPTTSTVKEAPVSGPPTTTGPPNVGLTFEAQKGDKQVSFFWTPYVGLDFGRYVMVRSTNEVVSFPPSSASAEMWSSDDRLSLTWIEAAFPLDAEVVRYQLFVVDKAGKVLAQSEVVKVELSIGTSTSSTTAPPPTVTSPSSTTTEQPKGD